LEDDEATAAAGIMLRILGEKVLGKTGLGIYASVDDENLCDPVHLCHQAVAARTVVVLLSPGSLESVLQLRVIAAVMQHCCHEEFPTVVPVHLPGFQFPSEHYFKHVLPSVWPASDAGMRLFVEEFFNNISIRFSTDASEKELITQAERVLERIPPKFQSGKKYDWDVMLSSAAGEASEHDNEDSKNDSSCSLN